MRLKEICEKRLAIIENIRVKVNSLMVGEKPSAMKGLGIDVEDFREYVYGDDFRHIDWKITAKIPYYDTPRFYVKEYREEKSLNTFVLLDSSSSMQMGEKWVTALGALIFFIETARRFKDRIGLLTIGVETPLVISPTSPVGLSEYIMSKACKGKIYPRGVLGLEESIRKIIPFLTHRMYVVLVTDIAHEYDEFKNSIRLLKERVNGLAVVLIVEPRELELPPIGLAVLNDYETPHNISMLSGDDVQTASAYLKRHLRLLENMLRTYTIPYVKVSHYREIPYAIKKMIEMYSIARVAAYV